MRTSAHEKRCSIVLSLVVAQDHWRFNFCACTYFLSTQKEAPMRAPNRSPISAFVHCGLGIAYQQQAHGQLIRKPIACRWLESTELSCRSTSGPAIASTDVNKEVGSAPNHVGMGS